MVSSISPKLSEFINRFTHDIAAVTQKPNKCFGNYIEDLAHEIPNNPALYFQDDSWTWQALNEECNKIANYFLSLGLNQGETVSLMLENSPEYLFLAGGFNKIQVISALTNFNQKKEALSHSFNIVNPKYIIVDGDCLPNFYKIIENIPQKHNQIFVINNKNDIPHDFVDLTAELETVSKLNPNITLDRILEEIALYIYTSGTTGLPKAVIMSHTKLFIQGLYLGKSLAELNPEDVIYLTSPLYHNLGIGCAWMSSIFSGAATALRKRFSASKFWEDIQKYKATYTMYVGEMPRYLLNQPPSTYEKNNSLKKMVGLGLRKKIWKQFKARFNVEHIYEFYGLTEGHLSVINIDENPGMVGKYNMIGLVLAKCNPDTGELYKNEKNYCIKCKPGDIGIVMLKIDKQSVFRGYSEKEKTQKKIMSNVFRKNDMYFNTGDMLQLHEDNWLSFYDRFGDTFRWKGENVSTLEVEAILNSYEAISLAAVYGVSIPNTEGKAGMAAIKLNPSIKFNLHEFSKFVQEVLPNYSIPIFIRMREELELTGPYKIKKVQLKKEAYDIKKIQDPIFLWDWTKKQYVPFTSELFQDLIEEKLQL